MNVPPPPCGTKKGKPRSPPLDPRNNVIALSRYQGNPFLTRPPAAVLALHPCPVGSGGSRQSQRVLKPPGRRNPEPIGQACRVPSAAGRSADPQSLAAIEPALVGEINPKGPGAIRPNGHRWPVLGERLQPAVVVGGGLQAANPDRSISRCAGQLELHPTVQRHNGIAIRPIAWGPWYRRARGIQNQALRTCQNPQPRPPDEGAALVRIVSWFPVSAGIRLY